MELSVLDQNDSLVQIKASGEIRQRKLPGDKEPLCELLGEEVYGKRVLLDLSNVDYIDSSGLGWLIVCQKRFKENQGGLVLHSLPQLVQNVLKVVQLDQVFTIAEDAETAANIPS